MILQSADAATVCANTRWCVHTLTQTLRLEEKKKPGPSLKQQQHPRRLVFFMSGEAELMFNSFMLEGKLVEHSAAQLLSVKAARFK